jgi:hypothetical protein
MFKFSGSDVQRMSVAAIGALLLTVTMIGSTVAPARAVEMAPLAQMPAQVRA